LADPALRCTFAIGFLILFGFIGVFTYVGFILMNPPHMLSMTALGLVFLVFLPSMVTTPAAGSVTRRLGPGAASAGSLAIAIAGLVLLLLPDLVAVVVGMTLVGIGTFFAQAVATGHVGRIAEGDKAAASGLYLSSYYCGGLAGAAVVGQLFDRFGWTSAVGGVLAALGLAAILGLKLKPKDNA
jgi:predicted MFS family arabinose efflux permease